MTTANESSDVNHEQALRDDIDSVRQQLILHGHERWQAMINDWKKGDESTCRCWLMYAANYLACTGTVRWAIDPVRAAWRNPQVADVDVTPLESLQFVLLTHKHADHTDQLLWQRLKHAPIQWMVPAFMRDMFVQVTGITDSRLKVVTPGQAVECCGLRILPFDGLHWEYDSADQGSEPVSRLGVPSMGYQLQWRDRTWLFVGDTRTYDASTLMLLRGADVLFCHVWLGRKAAQNRQPPLLEKFVSFVNALSPQERVVLAHLYETSRPPVDCWTAYHAERIVGEMSEQSSTSKPMVDVVWPKFGEAILL